MKIFRVPFRFPFVLMILFVAVLGMAWMTGCRPGFYGNYSDNESSSGTGVLDGIVTKSTASKSIRSQNNVTLAISGTAIKGAEVWIEELPDFPHQTTDENGAYRFTGLPIGLFHVVARFTEAGKTLKVRSEEVKSLPENSPEAKKHDLELLPATSVVTGILRDEDGKALPEGIELTLWGEKFFTGPGGVFISPPLPDGVNIGQIVVKAQKGLKGITFDAPFVSADQPTIIDIRLPSAGSVDDPPPAPFMAGSRNGVFTGAAMPGEFLELTAYSGSMEESKFRQLSFSWEKTLGELTVKSNAWEALWRAPDTGGLATITVTVTDKKGRTGQAHFRTGNNPFVLSIISRSPDADSSGIASTTVIEVGFNQEISAGSLTSSSFQVLNGSTPVSGTRGLSADKKKITFFPAGPLTAGTTYTIICSTSLLGTTGGSLSGASQWNFTTLAAPVAPVAPVAPSGPPTITGITAGTFATNQSFTLTGETGNTLEYVLSDGGPWTTYSEAVSLAVTTAAAFQVSARQKNPLGLYSSQTATITLIIDKVPPAIPTITGITAGTFAADQSFTLTGVPGNTLEYVLSEGGTWTAYTGSISLATTTTATFSVSARQKNPLGLYSPQTASITVAIDKVAPTVTTVTSTKIDGTYSLSQVIEITVQFTKLVKVTGTPQLTLETGATDQAVNYSGGDNSNTLTFAYTIQSGDNSTDLDYVSSTSLALNGGTVKDALGNNAVLTLATPGAAGSLGVGKALVVDAVRPAITLTAASAHAFAPSVLISVVCSKTSADFNPTKVILTNATMEASETVTVGRSFKIWAAPTSDGAVTVAFPENTVTDALALKNTAGNAVTWTFASKLNLNTTVAGTADSSGDSPKLFNPVGIARDSDGNLYVASKGISNIQKIAASNGAVTVFAGEAVFTSETSTDGLGTDARFSCLRGITFDNSGNLFVADTEVNHLIRKVTPNAAVSRFAGISPVASGYVNGTAGVAKFNQPYDLVFNASDSTILVTDNLNHVIRQVDSSGNVSLFAGVPLSSSTTDGAALGQAKFSFPSGICRDSSGNIFVTELGNHRIRKISNSQVTTFAGSTEGYLDHANGTSAMFSNPTGITVDPNGNLYVTDEGNNIIRAISPSGKVTTISGVQGNLGIVNGTAAARHRTPSGILYSVGKLYITDWDGHVLRRGE